MRVAIHYRDEDWTHGFIEYCISNRINYELVDCYDFSIIEKLKNFDVLLWHFTHNSAQDILIARSILFSAAQMGLTVYPGFESSWHFDDKLTETYLLQAIGAPIAPSYMFYEERAALSWLREKAEYPLVAKLRRGAGSFNVKLISNYGEGKKYCSRMFGAGIAPGVPYFPDLKHVYKKAGNFRNRIAKLKKVPAHFSKVFRERYLPREVGYVYFQRFIPGNKRDIRVSIIGDRGWAFSRGVREGDFRASGSGIIDYDESNIPLDALAISFDVSKKLKTQSICFDYVTDSTGKLFILEMSYGFVHSVVHNSNGFWDSNLKWHQEKIKPSHAVMDDLIKNRLKLLGKSRL